MIKKIFFNKHPLQIAILILCFLVISFSTTFYFEFKQYLNEFINKNVSNRTISFNPDNLTTALEMEHILRIYQTKQTYYTSFSNSFSSFGLDGAVSLYPGVKENLPDVSYGKTIDENSEGTAICPTQFYPDSAVNTFQMAKEKILTPNKMLNYSFSIDNTNDQKMNFQIVGFYDAEEYYNATNECYISLKSYNKIDIPYASNVCYAIIDDVKNVSFVIDALKEKGIRATPNILIDNDAIKKVEQFVFLITFFVTILSLSITILFLKKNLTKEIRNIGIDRAIGYSKKDIIKKSISENLIYSTLLFFMGSLLYLIIFYLIKYLFQTFLTSIGINLSLHISVFLLSGMIIIFLPTLFSFLFFMRNLKKEITEQLRYGEIS